MKKSFRRIRNCRACGSDNLRAYLDLPSSPPANGLLRPGQQDPERIELMMMLCEDCFLSQLSVVVDPEAIYRDYAYHSSVSKTFKAHCRSMAKTIKSGFNFKEKSPFLMDIASNDGCLMREFRAEGFRVSGVEPCKAMADSCNEEGMPTLNRFFSKESVEKLSIGPVDVITATNVFAHVDDLDGFLGGVKCLLEPDLGVFVVEVPHMLSIVNFNQFDTIYHEHLSYFLLKPMVGLFQRNGLTIFRAEKLDIHGGSIRVYACHDSARKVESSVGEVIALEESSGMYEKDTYKDFANWVVRLGADLRTVLDFTMECGKKVIGYGASAKGISMTNYLGIGKYIHSIVDDTPAKQGLLTPGERIGIHPFEAFESEKPDYILLFAWNFAEEMMEKTKHLGARYIVPIPSPQILDPVAQELVAS